MNESAQTEPKELLLPERKWGDAISEMGLRPDDIRTKKLQAFLPHIPVNSGMPVPWTVAQCLKALNHLEITDDEKKLIAETVTAEADAEILEPYGTLLTSLIREGGRRAATIISLGCGGEGRMERVLADRIRKDKDLASVDVKWIGLETSDKRTDTSFFRDAGNEFVVKRPMDNPHYADLISDNSLKLMIANFSYHHLGRGFTNFLAQCKGLERVVLLEQPVTRKQWEDPVHRTAKIAYDVLMNAGLDPEWIAQASNNPDLFKVSYLLEEEIPKGSDVTRFPKVVPGCALIDFKP